MSAPTQASFSPEAPRRSILGLVFLTVFLDMVGFSIIFPLFPDMLEWYVGTEGEGSFVARVAAQLAELVDGDKFAVIVLFGGLLGSLYSGAQFLFAPIWGAVSDRIGRRPTILLTLLGTALSYIVWFFAGSFWLLVAARLFGGVMAGNISTASAAVADTHKGSDRAKGMGVLGAGIGLGFVIGPALGGLASGWDLTGIWGGATAAGVNPFSGAAAVAFALALVNLTWAAARFPETLSGEAQPEERRGLNPFGALRRLDYAGVRPLNLAYFVYFVAFGAMEFTLVFLAKEHLDYGPAQNAAMFVFIGLVIALVQGGLVRRMVPKRGERAVAFMGMAMTLPGFFLLAAVTRMESQAVLYAGLLLVAMGSSMVMPSFSSLASRYVPDDRQGFALGVFRSFGSLARVLGPLAGGALYFGLGSIAPYAAAGAILLLPIAIARGLPEVPASPPGEASR